MADAYCATYPDRHRLWFADQRSPGGRRDLERAKSLCHGCDVEQECFECAMCDVRLVGIFGATDERDRARMRRKRSA
jgi:hypothetical protein